MPDRQSIQIENAKLRERLSKEQERGKELSQSIQIQNAKLAEKLSKEWERGRQLSHSIRTHVNEIINSNIDPQIKTAGQQFLDAKNDQEEKIAISDFLKAVNLWKKSNSHLPFFRTPQGDQVTDHDSTVPEQEDCAKKPRLS